jgi:hypothetical protein
LSAYYSKHTLEKTVPVGEGKNKYPSMCAGNKRKGETRYIWKIYSVALTRV